MSEADFQLQHFPARPPRASLTIFFGSMWAFLLREFKNRYGSSRLGVFWGLLDPIVTIGFLLVMHTFIRGNSHGLIYGEHPLVFFIWGVAPFFMWQHGSSACNGVCNASRGLFNYRQIRPIDIMIARVLLEMLELGTALVLCLGAFAYFDIRIDIDNPAGVLSMMILAFFTALSTGMLFEVYATAFPELRRVFAFITRPMVFLSGLFFTIDALADRVGAWFLWNPILHLVDLTRGAALLGYDSPGSVSYIILFDCVAMTIALAGYRRFMHLLV